MRWIVLAAIISAFCRWALGKWPWDYLRPAPSRSQALFKARRLLAVRDGAGREEIVDAHRRLLTMIHPDRGGSSAQVHEANAARDLLLDHLPHDQ
jgi:DnaJ homolog subfamily C member 19